MLQARPLLLLPEFGSHVSPLQWFCAVSELIPLMVLIPICGEGIEVMASPKCIGIFRNYIGRSVYIYFVGRGTYFQSF